MATAAEKEIARIAAESCAFPEAGPTKPWLSVNQILSLTVFLLIVAWRYVAIFWRKKKNQKLLEAGLAVEDEEYSKKRTDGRKVEFCDCGKGGPLDVWLWIITKLPCIALALGMVVPAFLSFEGMRQSKWTMDIDMDFAGYVKTETQMQLHQDALATAVKCRRDAITLNRENEQRRRLQHFGFDNYLTVDLDHLHPKLFDDDTDDEMKNYFNDTYFNDQSDTNHLQYYGALGTFDALDALDTFDDSNVLDEEQHRVHSRHLAKKTKNTGPHWTLDIFYEKSDAAPKNANADQPDYGVFDKITLAEIKEFEKELKKFPGFESHDQGNNIYEQCWKFRSGSPCEPPQSPINIFYSTNNVNAFGNATTGAFDGNGPLKDIGNVLRYLFQKDILIFTDLEFSKNKLKSSFTRSRFRGHGPGAHTFLRNLYDQLLLREQDPATRKYQNIKITWSDKGYLKTHEIMVALMHDSLYALGSFVFVGVFMVLHLRSLLLAFFAIYGILISFPAAYYFFFVTMGFRKMMLLNFVALFLIMGIGADDVFVMFDAYNQAAAVLGHRSSPGQRLRWAYLEAGSAMLVTTITTAGSFYSNCVSEVIVVRQFGFFMGTVVLLNWVHVMVIFPSFLLIYEICWARFWKCCCCCLHRFFPEPIYEDSEDEEEEQEEEQKSAQDTVAEVEERHAKEVADREAAIEAQKVAQHERLQNRLKHRHDTPAVAKKEDKVSVGKVPKSPIRKAAKVSGRMAMIMSKKEDKTSDAPKLVKAKSFMLIKDEHIGGEHLDISQLGSVERCFNTRFSPFLFKFRFPLCIAMIGLAVGGVMMVLAHFTPGDAPIIFLEDRNLGRLQRIMIESGLADLSIADEKTAMKEFPNKEFTRPTCPGLLPDGLTYCNGQGDCPYNECKGPPDTCRLEKITSLERAKMFACKCLPQWSGYNCSLPSKPGSIGIVRSISTKFVNEFSSSQKIASAPFIQILIFNEDVDTTLKATLVNMGDEPVSWKVAGVGDINKQPVALDKWTDTVPGGVDTPIVKIVPSSGVIAPAMYLSALGTPMPGTADITFKVD
jgi:hypothetical protein